MSSCGKKREQFQAAAPVGHAPSARPTGLPHPLRIQNNRFLFEYTGRTAMNVIGPATGRRYRFEHPGARQEVDMRDRVALTHVPNLRLVALTSPRKKRATRQRFPHKERVPPKNSIARKILTRTEGKLLLGRLFISGNSAATGLSPAGVLARDSRSKLTRWRERRFAFRRFCLFPAGCNCRGTAHTVPSSTVWTHPEDTRLYLRRTTLD